MTNKEKGKDLKGVIPLARPRLGSEEFKAVQRVLESRHLAQGPEVREFEREVGEVLGGRTVTAVSSGGAALLLSLVASGVKEGDEVVVPAFTFPAAAQAAAWLGARPVPADVDPDTLAVTPHTVEAVLSNRTRAVVVAHQFGIPANVEGLHELAVSRGYRLIEDAACAFGGATPSGRPVGTVGDLACFSLHPRKLLTGGEGGFITCDSNLAEHIRVLRDYGRTGSGFGDVFGEIGLNFRLNDLSAAVARVQVARVPDSIEVRGRLARQYIERLEGCDPVNVPQGYSLPGQTWQSFVVGVAGGGEPVVEMLRKEGLETGPAAYDLGGQEFYRDRWGMEAKCPVSSALAMEMMALPLFEEMTPGQVDTVADALIEGTEGGVSWKT